jgi:transglutaminase-like putative cysteine protease
MPLLGSAFIRAKRSEKLTTLALLFILLTIATASVTSVLISPNWSSLWESLLLGLLIGWGVAVFRASAWRAALISIATSLIFSLLFTSGLDEKLIAVFSELIRLFIHIPFAPRGAQIDLTPLANQYLELNTSISVVMGRVLAWLAALGSGQAAFDPVAAAFVWSTTVWLIAAWAGWIAEARKSALLAVLPAILLSVGTLSYARRMSFTVYLILGATLILLATIQHDQREQEWDETRIAYPVWKGRQIGSAAIIVTVLLVLLSAFVSSISFQNLVKWVSDRRGTSAQQDGGLAKSLGILPAATPAPDAFQEVRRPGLPRDLLIGTGPELSQRVVMSVEIVNLPNIAGKGLLVPIYWRSFTYDVYTGSGWQTSSTDESSYQADQPLQPDNAPDHILVQQIVRPANENDLAVYADGEPQKLNLQSEAAWRSSADLFGIRLDGPASYEVDSLVPIADESELRSAGQSYPDWIRQRYLSLPSEVPGRVKSMAIELTASAPTPYDRARAIERYLRTFPYTLDVPRPPSNRDVVDYFLFDLRKGYCDYYASAMVVLARAAGIPARLAVGYASGTYNLNSQRFIVTEADAHSWVEVYFPGIGWVPFEPTAAQPALNRSQNPTPETFSRMPPSPLTPNENTSKSLYLFWLGGVALLAILGIGLASLDEIRLRRLSEQETIIEIYRRMKRYGALLLVYGEPGETPYEFFTSLRSRLQDLSSAGVAPLFWLDLVERFHSMTRKIVLAIYRPSQIKSTYKSDILRNWWSLRWRLRLSLIIRTWISIHNRFKLRLARTSEQDIARN